MAENKNLTGRWEKHFNKSYIGEWDFEDGKDLVTKITGVTEEEIPSPNNGGKKEDKIVVHFEGLKPLILNTTNAKRITSATGSAKMEDWIGKPVQLCVEPCAAFGTMTMAVRVREFAPRV